MINKFKRLVRAILGNPQDILNEPYYYDEASVLSANVRKARAIVYALNHSSAPVLTSEREKANAMLDSAIEQERKYWESRDCKK